MFNNLFPPIKSGSSHFTFMLSKMLAARGHDITVIAAHIEGTAAHEQYDGLDIHRLPCLMMPRLEIAHGFKYLSYTFLPSPICYSERTVFYPEEQLCKNNSTFHKIQKTLF